MVSNTTHYRYLTFVYRISSAGTSLFVGSILCGSVQPDKHRGMQAVATLSYTILSSFQTMVVPILEDLLGWSEFETSLFFCGAGVEVRPIRLCQELCVYFIYCFTKAYHVIYCVDTTKQEDS